MRLPFDVNVDEDKQERQDENSRFHEQPHGKPQPAGNIGRAAAVNEIVRGRDGRACRVRVV
jgi:hypothetical protein